jgi:hypothetical protein
MGVDVSEDADALLRTVDAVTRRQSKASVFK